ncbi:MAG: c-type cytochrome [Acidimicrobiia bacterium]|nr:c-type cytochrome [Acidimicrobiia bacterium]
MPKKYFAIVSVLMILTACGGTKTEEKAAPVPSKPIGTVIEIKAPLGLPPVPVPADNPPTAETIALGRRLYYDKGLSVDGTIACASCHDPEKGFSDASPNSAGVGGKRGDRNSPTVWNSAYNTLQFWDGRSPSLENQAEGPVQNPIEMANTLEAVEKKLSADASYVAEFEKAYGPGPITYEKVGKAIASFERTVLSGNSAFDKYQYGGDKKAMSASAIRGLEIYQNPAKGNCAACHTIEKDHALFTDNKFHNIGVGIDSKGELKDLGRFKETQVETDKGAFKTPTLRNIAATAPYMHDGSLKTLKDVVDFYVGGGSSNPHLDQEIKALKLSKQDRDDLEAFLNALTGETPPNIGAPAVGGN